jgi:hypothetical protein
MDSAKPLACPARHKLTGYSHGVMPPWHRTVSLADDAANLPAFHPTCYDEVLKR